MLCNDPPERAVLGRSSGVQEVHVELLQVICSLDDDLGSLRSPPAGRTTAAHGRSSVDGVNRSSGRVALHSLNHVLVERIFI